MVHVWKIHGTCSPRDGDDDGGDDDDDDDDLTGTTQG